MTTALYRDASRSLVDASGRPLFIPRYRLLSGDLSHRLPPLYLDACRFFASPLIDRTATLDDGIGYRILDPIRALSPPDESFAQLCDTRAQALIKRAVVERRQIELLWSGGIDSTTALVALLRVAQQSDTLCHIRVLLSEHSIREYPRFFHQVIEPRLSWRRFEPPVYSELDPSHISVTGEHGDQLFGSDKLALPMAQGYAFAPWPEALPRLIRSRLPDGPQPDQLIDWLLPQLARSPVPLTSLWDLLWWLNYSLKWQYVALRLLTNASREGESAFRLEGNLVNFFTSAPFQAWALQPREQKVGAQWASYKYPAKEYIHAYLPDSDYRDHKLKEASLNGVIVHDDFSFLRPASDELE